jgi:hypothetical protein
MNFSKALFRNHIIGANSDKKSKYQRNKKSKDSIKSLENVLTEAKE